MQGYSSLQIGETVVVTGLAQMAVSPFTTHIARNIDLRVMLAFGTAMNDRLHFHWNRLIEDINPARSAVQQFLDAHMRRFDGMISGEPTQAAIKLLAAAVQREALVLTYNDVVMLLGVGFAFGLALMPLVKNPRSALTADRH